MSGARGWARRVLERSDSPALACLLTLAAYLAFVVVELRASGGDPSAFIVAGEVFVDPSATPTTIATRPDAGYDGQFYYRLALDPFTDQARAHGVRFDHPSFRQQRILYPLLAHLLALGRGAWVPASLVATNLIAVALLGWLAALLARELGRHALLGLLVSFYPGFLFTLGFDLAEIVAGAWITGGILALARSRPRLAALAFVAAVLTRESTLLVPAGAGLVLLARWWRESSLRAHPWPWMLLPLASYVGIQLALANRWGVAPFRGGIKGLGAPFSGLTEFLEQALAEAGASKMNLYACALVLAVIAVALLRLRPSVRLPEVALAFALYACMVLSLSTVLWAGYGEFLRASSECHLAAAVVVLANRRRWDPLVLLAVLAVWRRLFLDLT